MDRQEPESWLSRWARRYTIPVLTALLFLGTALVKYSLDRPTPVSSSSSQATVTVTVMVTTAPQPTETVPSAADVLASARIINVAEWPDVEPLTLNVPAAIANNTMTDSNAVPYIENDLAWNKPTYASSFLETGLPRRATNGPDAAAGPDAWRAQGSDDTWFIVDLGGPTTFGSLVSTLLVNLTEADMSYIVSDDLKTWRIVYNEAQSLTRETIDQLGAPRKIILPEPVTARYVGIYGHNWAGGGVSLSLFAVLP